MSKDASLLIRGASTRSLQTLINIGIGFWMLPFLITHLGSADYALWILVGSIISSYYILDMGLTQSVTRYVAKYIYNKEYKKANSVISSALFIYSILSLVIFIGIIFAILFIAPSLADTAEELKTAQVLLLISGLSLGLEFPSKAFTGIINAYLRFDTIAAIRTLGNICSAIAIYFYISMGSGVIALAIIILLTNVFTTGFYIYYSTSLFTNLEVNTKLISKAYMSKMFHFSKWSFITDVTNILKTKMDIWFIAALISTSAVTIYYVAMRLVDYAAEMVTQALGLTGPIFIKYYAKGSTKKLNEILVFFVKLYILLFVIIFSGFYVLGDDFLKLWVNEGIDSNLSYECLIVLTVGRLIILSLAPFNSYLMTINKHRYSAYISIFDTVVALVLAILIIPKYGILGAAISCSLSVAIIRLIALPSILLKFVNINLKPLFYRGLLFILYGVVIVLLFESFNISILKWRDLFLPSIAIVLCVLFGLIILFNKKEKKGMYVWLKKNIRFS